MLWELKGPQWCYVCSKKDIGDISADCSAFFTGVSLLVPDIFSVFEGFGTQVMYNFLEANVNLFKTIII